MSREITSRFGARIRELRLAKKMRQIDLAERVGIQEAYVSSIESGKKEPCLRVIEMLADGLGVSLRKLFWDL
jgi:transcriptional regulator with XRE-family HTH domain